MQFRTLTPCGRSATLWRFPRDLSYLWLSFAFSVPPRRWGRDMADVFDVAAYILKKHGPMSSMKLQKLVYYSQAWSLVWDEKPIFKEKIRAWAGGPAVPELFFEHQGRFTVDKEPRGKSGNLTEDERDTVDAIVKFYGDRTGQWLSDLTHKERPWLEARAGLADGERGNAEITYAAMAEYYSGLS
jgi:uncharacterized phage-associated protein